MITTWLEDFWFGFLGFWLLWKNKMDRSALTMGPGMDMPIMHDSDRYELVRDIGSGNFGVARLMRDKLTNELVAVKYIERGEKVSLQIEFFYSIFNFFTIFQNRWYPLPRIQQIDENVQREIINHRSLRHPNIVRFKEVLSSNFRIIIISGTKKGFLVMIFYWFPGHFDTNSSCYCNGICIWWRIVWAHM